MKKIIIILIFPFLSYPAFSQTRVWIQDVSAFKFQLDGVRGGIDYNNVKGSPYLFPDLKEGRIITKENEFLPCKLRYDIYANQMELLVEGKSYLITKPEGFKEFYIDSIRIQFVSYNVGSTTKNGFMIVENDSAAYRLYTRKQIIYLKADEAKPYTDPKPERFEAKDDMYYLSYRGAPALEISSLKKMVKTFPDLKAVVENYPEKRVDFAKLEEVVKLVDFINQKVQ